MNKGKVCIVKLLTLKGTQFIKLFNKKFCFEDKKVECLFNNESFLSLKEDFPLKKGNIIFVEQVGT